MKDQAKTKGTLLNEPATCIREDRIEEQLPDENLVWNRRESFPKTVRSHSDWKAIFPIVPIPSFLVLFLILAILDIRTVFEPSWLLPATNVLFLLIIPLAVVCFATQGYAKSGIFTLLMLGVGTLALGLGALLAGCALILGGPNANVTVFNASALFSAMFQVLGAVLAYIGMDSQRNTRRKKLNVTFTYLGTTILLALLTIATLKDLTPIFFVQSEGPTVWRQTVLATAVVLFVMSGILFVGLYLFSKTKVLYWYSLALFLIATGLICVLFQKSVGSPIGWLGRGSQYLGGIYLLVAVVSAWKDLRSDALNVQRGIADLFRHRLAMLVEERTSELRRTNEQLSQEIAERRRAQEALRESEEKYRTLFEESFDGLFITSPGGRILDMNKKGVAIFGYDTKEEVLRLDLERDVYAHPPNRKRILSMVNAQGSAEYEVVVKKKSGEEMVTYCSLTAVRDETGQITSYRGIIRDITERKRAEERNLRMAAIVESSDDAIIGKTLDGIITSWNRGAEKIYGYEETEAVGKPIFLLVPPDRQDEVSQFLVRIRRGEHVEHFETVRRRKDGREVDVSLTISPIIGVEGSIVGASTIAHDMTERKKTENALATTKRLLTNILSAAPIGISYVEKGTLKWTNQTMVKMFGHEHEKEYLDRKVREFYASDEEYKRVRKEISKSLGERRLADTEVRFRRKDGTVFFGQMRTSASDPSNPEEGTITTILDITERKRAEEALRLSEERYRILVDKAPVGIISVDKEGTIVEVNQKLLQILGSPSANATKAINMLSFQLLVDSGISDVFSRCMAYGTEQSAEIPYTSKWGKTAYLRILMTPLVGVRGNIEGCQAVMEDVSERKEAEEARRKSEERYRATFDNAAVGIDLVDRDGRFIQANDTLLNFLNYTREELRDCTMFDCIHPSDIERAKENFYALVRGDIESYRLEQRYVRKDGSVVWADTSVSAIRGQAGEYFASVAVIADITSRKKSDEARVRLATAIEQAAESIMITDAEGTVAYVNPSFESTTGYSLQEAIGANPRILKSGQHDERFYTDMWRTISSGKVWKGHLINRKKDGTLFEEEATISPVRDDSGGIVNYVAVKRDVTKEVLLQRQLLQAQKMEAVGTLAGGIAHDFNNLLTIIMGFSELLLAERHDKDPEYPDLQKIFDASKSGAELVQRLLLFSRKSETKPVSMNLNKLILQVEKLLRRAIPRMIDIRLDLSPDLPEINADPSQVEQILLNLAVNARDAMPHGGDLTVSTQSVALDEEYCRLHVVGATPGQYVLLRVSDTGQGMDSETVEHIFEPFFTTKERGQGTGLGLAMVYGIVKQHNGHITVYSEVDQGTIFRVYFPAITPDVEPDVAESAIMPAFGTETILLVDDEEFVRELGARILTKHGYTVLQAENGREAVKLFKRERSRILLVILDLVMPKMGGLECLEKLLDIDPQVTVLVASGYSAEESVKDMIRMGAKGFVTKPFGANELLREVRKVLDEG